MYSPARELSDHHSFNICWLVILIILLTVAVDALCTSQEPTIFYT